MVSEQNMNDRQLVKRVSHGYCGSL